MTARRRPSPVLRAITVALALLTVAVIGSGRSSATNAQATAQINGTGSSYVGLAMSQWTAEGQSLGLQVNYTPTGSIDGLSRYAGGQVDFAGTEAEFASLGVQAVVQRGYQYVPDVAGAVSVMYNIDDVSGRPVDYLHLSRSTVAKIFMGEITHWDDAAIQSENAPANLRLPHEPINVVYRSGESGTTALFYDFVREMEPEIYAGWAARNGLSGKIRIIALNSSFAPKTQALNSSDQIAQYVASGAGKWSIAYDEFGYAKIFDVNAAWIENQQGKWVLPYAENISAALDTASLREDLSQELKDVYRSPNPLAYPISAYSYLVAQCEQAADRPTCAGQYANPGVAGTLTRWMRYIACEGQVKMAQLGYSPLPPNLSQEMANSIGRMNGVAAESLNAGNCANPRFSGSLGAGATSPADPYLGLAGFSGNPDPGETAAAGGGGADAVAYEGTNGDAGAAGGPAVGGNGAAGGATGTGASTEAVAIGGSADAAVAAGRSGSTAAAAGGGSLTWRDGEPILYARVPVDASRWPLLVFLAVLALPVVVVSLIGSARRRRSDLPMT